MPKYLINKGVDALSNALTEREVEANDMLIRGDFLDFDKRDYTVFRVKTDMVYTVEVVEET